MECLSHTEIERVLRAENGKFPEAEAHIEGCLTCLKKAERISKLHLRAAVREAAQRILASGDGWKGRGCPPATLLASNPNRADVQKHLTHCGDCRDQMTALAEVEESWDEDHEGGEDDD